MGSGSRWSRLSRVPRLSEDRQGKFCKEVLADPQGKVGVDTILCPKLSHTYLVGPCLLLLPEMIHDIFMFVLPPADEVSVVHSPFYSIRSAFRLHQLFLALLSPSLWPVCSLILAPAIPLFSLLASLVCVARWRGSKCCKTTRFLPFPVPHKTLSSTLS